MVPISSGTLLGISIFILVVLSYLFFYLSIKKRDKEIEIAKADGARRLYELSILKELGERVGYSLNVEEILKIIKGSLKQFIDYTAVGYVVIVPEKIKVRTYCEEPASEKFLTEMKERMIASLSALTDKNYKDSEIDLKSSGAISSKEKIQTIGSIFNIPLVIGGEVMGVLSVTHTEKGLYREEDMTILYKIVSQASAAVSRLQEVLKTEQSKLNIMVESMGDGVIMVDDEFQIVVANPAVKKIINFRGEKNLNIFDFIDALGGKFDIKGRLEEVVAKKKPFLSQMVVMNEAFYEIGVYPVSHGPLKNADARLGAVVVFHDITRDIELAKVREQFTSMIVHELRSPLDGIKKIIELLVSGHVRASSKDFKEYLGMAYQSSSSLLHLVNDILDLSKLEAGKFEIHKEKSNIKDAVENRIMFYNVSALTRKISLLTYFDENLPESALFDPAAVKQILNNFISNALKYTSEKGKILVSAFVCGSGDDLPQGLLKSRVLSKFAVFPKKDDFKLKGRSLCIVVSDTGIGIPEMSLKDLFHTYKQAKFSPVDKESRGTGLGLVIASGIVEAHEGTIGVVSEEGRGSSFFFTIPLHQG